MKINTCSISLSLVKCQVETCLYVWRCFILQGQLLIYVIYINVSISNLIDLEKKLKIWFICHFSTRINREIYLSRVTDQKISLAVMWLYYFTTKWWQMHRWCLVPQSCSGGVHRVLASKPARMLKELFQYFSGGIRANKWDVLITLLLCRSEINFKVYSQVKTLTIKVQNKFIPK